MRLPGSALVEGAHVVSCSGDIAGSFAACNKLAACTRHGAPVSALDKGLAEKDEVGNRFAAIGQVPDEHIRVLLAGDETESRVRRLLCKSLEYRDMSPYVAAPIFGDGNDE